MSIRACKAVAVTTTLISLLAVSGWASAATLTTTVTFSDLTGPLLGPAGTGSVYVEPILPGLPSLIFTSSFPGGDLQHWGSGDAENADPGGATLYKSEVDTPVDVGLTVTRTGGGRFDLNSLDLADADNTALASSVTLTYTNPIGTFTSTLTRSGVGLQTFTFGAAQRDLTSFSLSGVDFQLDNVVYTIPEPASYGLMLAGLAAVGALARVRARSV